MKVSGTRILLAALLALLGVAAALPASAANRNRLSFLLDCNGFTSRGGGVVMNRDNTGAGREVIWITGQDGAGNVIFGPVENSALIGTSVTFDNGTSFRWNAAPAANPLTLTITSVGGNGLEEQRVYVSAGLCSTLPAPLPVTTDGDDNLLIGDGVPSASVPINGNPPRPDGDVSLARAQAGYAIVNSEAVNLRSGDGPFYTVVGIVEGGDELVVLGRNGDDSWWFVQAGEIRGWISNDLVLLRGDLTDIPLVPVLGEIARPTLFIHITQPIYNAPGGSPLCTIESRREYYITRRTDSDPVWYELEAVCENTVVYGWILADNGSFRNPGEVVIPIR